MYEMSWETKTALDMTNPELGPDTLDTGPHGRQLRL